MTAFEYWKNNYHGRLLIGGGVEALFGELRGIKSSGAWCDLGAGPFSMLWALGIEGVTDLTAFDIDSNALGIAKRNWGDFLEGPFVESMVSAGVVSGNDVARVRALPRRFVARDCINDLAGIREADLVTSFGLAGLVPERNQLEDWFRASSSKVASNGFLLGASWISKAGSPLREFGAEGVDFILRDVGLSDVRVETIPVSVDQFEQILVWQGKRTGLTHSAS